MAKLVQLAGGGPVNEGERIVVQTLLAQLPADYVVVPNIEIPDGRGQRLEYDIVVGAPHAVYVVETKAIHGDIFGDDREFVVNGSTRPAPIRITAHKSRVLKSFLMDQRPVLRSAWVEPIVVLAVPPRSLELLGEARRTTLLLPELVDFLTSPDRLPHPPRPLDGLAETVGGLLRSHASAWTGPLAFNQWEVVDTLHVDDEMTEYRAANRFAVAAPEVRLRVYSLSQYRYTKEQLDRRRQAIVREFVALQAMGAHQNIVGAQDVFDDEAGNVILVVPEIPGISLGIAVSEGLDLSDDERRSHLLGLARAIAHAHEHGVIHRRISPENVILMDDGGVRLTGFGKARVESEGTIYQTSTDVGVPDGYAAPELFDLRLGEASFATDLYGLGAVAWVLWTEEAPEVESVVPSRPPSFPEDTYDLIAPWLSRRPEERTTRLEDLIRVLEFVAEPDPVSTPVESGRDEAMKAPAQYEPGDIIEGRYVVTSVLGAGGFSTVYRVEDSILETSAALKVFNPQFGLDTMQREIRALRKVSHPNIVRLIDAGQIHTRPPQWFMKSEFVDGVVLSDLLDRGERFGFERSVELIAQLLDALIAIHPDARRIAELKAKDDLDRDEFYEMQELAEAGLVHRDIKPQNLIVTLDDRIMLIDFNIASRAGTPVETVAGTPAYQPPDADLSQWDVSTDLFATGLVFFELVTGQHAFEDRNPMRGQPRKAADLMPGLARSLSEFLSRACAPERVDRFATAVEMRDALGRALDTEPAPIPEPLPPGPESAVSPPDSFRGIAVELAPLTGHHQVGWVTTPDYRLPIVLTTSDDQAADPAAVLSATTSALDTRYAAPRGAYMWTSAGKALGYAQAVAGDWRVGDPVTGLEPVSEQLGEGEWRFLWRDLQIDEISNSGLDLEVRIEDKDGDAFFVAVAISGDPSDTPFPSTDGDEVEAEVSDDLPADVVNFLYNRVGRDAPALPLMREFLVRALSRGDIVLDLGSSAKNKDGLGRYVLLRWDGPQRYGAVAFLWPNTARLTWRLPLAAAEGRRWVVAREGENASVYQLKSKLESQEALEESLELLSEAVAAVTAEPGGSASSPLGEEDPRWERHSGGTGHSAAEWSSADLELATALVRDLPTKAAAFLRALADVPGIEVPADRLADVMDVKGAAGLAGALGPFSKVRGLGRRFPFYWWEGDPSTYAMKPSVAEVFSAALEAGPPADLGDMKPMVMESLPGMYFGFTGGEWEQLVNAGLEYLSQRARRRQDTDYTEFCQAVRRSTGLQIEPGDHALRTLLGDISKRTFDEHGVILTVIVRYKGGSEAGEGLFGLAQDLGVLPKGRLDEDAKLRFQAEQTEAVFAVYSRSRRRVTSPDSPAVTKRDENKRVFAAIRALEEAGDFGAAATMAREYGWDDLAASIEQRGKRRVGHAPPTGGTYVPLTVFLRDHPAAQVEISFDEIEEIIGRSLPPSARRHRPWWANTEGNSQALSWLSAGWKVRHADLGTERVLFARARD